MNAFVLDASCAVAALLAEETGSETEAVLTRLSTDGPWVPAVWFVEVGNALEMARRRKRISKSDLQTALDIITSWAVNVDKDDAQARLQRYIELSQLHELTVYDAAYLELALRMGAPLATLDKRLGAAAKRAGLAVLGLTA